MLIQEKKYRAAQFGGTGLRNKNKYIKKAENLHQPPQKQAKTTEN